MTFFNWQPANLNGQSHVSPFFWIYWAVSLPLTVLVVGSFLLWERSESRKSEEEDNKTDKEMTAMMLEAQNPMVARTRKRARTGDCEAAK
jgi:cytochrome c-type biogenesis protein CcmH/NrfF